MRDLAFALIWMVALPLSFMSAQAGVLLWIWVALLSPSELLYGFMAGVPFNKLVAILSIGLIVVNREKKDFYVDTTLVLAGLLAVVSTLSYFMAQLPDSFDLYSKLLKEIVLLVMITGVCNTRNRLQMVVFITVASLAFLGVKEGLISILTAGGHQIVGSGGIGDNNSLALALLMCIPLMFYLAQSFVLKPLRLGLLGAIGLSLITIVMTYSRGGFLGLLVVGGLFVKNSRSKGVAIVLAVIAGLAIWSLAPESWFSRLNTINDAKEDGSFMGRVVAWKVSTLIAFDSPLWGGGPHAVQRPQIWFSQVPRIFTLPWPPTPNLPNYAVAAHSIYFEVLGDLGFTGLGLFVAILLHGIWSCSRIVRRTVGDPSLLWAHDLARMLQISLVVYAVSGALLSMAYFEMYWVLIAVISRLRRTVDQERAQRSMTVTQPTAQVPGARPALAQPIRQRPPVHARAARAP